MQRTTLAVAVGVYDLLLSLAELVYLFAHELPSCSAITKRPA